MSGGLPFEFWYLYLGMATISAIALVFAYYAYRLSRRQQELLADLAASEERFVQAAKQSRTVVWEFNTDGLYTFVSPVSTEVFGYEPGEMVGKQYVWDLHPEDGREDLRRLALQGIAERVSYKDFRSFVQTRDGRIITVSTTAYPLLNADGSVRCYRGAGTDITARVEAEEALRESEMQLRYAMDAASDGIWDWNLVTGEMTLTPRVYEMMGYEPYEFRMHSDNWMERLHPDDRIRAMEAVQEGLASPGQVGSAEYRIARKDGGWLWVLSRGKLVEQTPDGTPLRIVGTLVDIQERKESQAALEASDALFESLTANVPSVIYQFRAWPDGRTIVPYVSEGVRELYGVTPEELREDGRIIVDRVHPDDRNRVIESILASFSSLEDWVDEFRVVMPDGTVQWLQGRGRPEAQGDGSVLWHGSLTDITDRKKAQLELEASEERFRRMFELGLIGIAIATPDRKLVHINNRLADILDRSVDELMEVDWASFTHPEDLPAEMANYEAMISGKVDRFQLEKRYFRQDGEIVHIQLSASCLRDDAGTVTECIGFVEDITERKRTLLALEASEERFRSFFEIGLIGMALGTPDKGSVLFNDCLCEMTGYTKAELAAMPWTDLTHPDDLAEDIAQFEAMLSGEQDGYTLEKRLVRKDGSTIFVMVSARAVRGQDGQVQHTIALIEDITSRKEAQGALEERDALFAKLSENVPGAIYQLKMWPDGNLAFQYVSEGAREMYEVSPEEVRGDTSIIFQRTHPDDLERILTSIRESYETMEVWSQEFRVVTPTRGVRWMQGRSRPEKQEDGSVIWYGYTADITERKHAEEEAREEEVRAQRQGAALSELAVSTAIANGDLEEAKRQLAETTARALDAERVGLWLLSEDGEVHTCFELFELSKEAHSEGEVLYRRNYPAYFEALRATGRLIANDVYTHPGTACFAGGYLEKFGITSMLDVAIHVEGRLAGVVCIEHTGPPRTWHSDEDSFVTTVAALTAQTLANAERKLAEEALEARDALFAKLSEHVPGVIYQFQMWPDGRMAFPYISEGSIEMYGFTPEEVLAESAALMERVHPDDKEAFAASIQASFASLEDWILEFRIMQPVLGLRWIHGRSRPEKQEDGSVIWYGYTTDITERRQAEEQAREDERRANRQRAALAKLVVSKPVSEGDLSMAKRLLAEVAARTLDVARASLWRLSEDGTELVCFELFELHNGQHSEGAVLCSEDYLPYFEGIRRFGRIVANDAQTEPWTACFAESYLKPLGITSMLDAGYHIGGRLAGVVCLEHTGEARTWQADEESFVTTLAALTAQLLTTAERNRAEAALAERDALFAKLSENVPGFLFQYQLFPDGRSCFPFASEAMRYIYGVGPEEVREDATAIWELGHPEDREAVRQGLTKSMETGELWNQTFRIILPDRGMRWMRGQARPEAQEDGSTIWYGYISDITEQVEAFEERRQLEQQFERTQRLESLGVMAGGIAHDFNNILMAVLANAEVVQREVPADSPAMRPLSEIHAAADRAAELCRQMLAYAGKSSMVSEQMQIGKMVGELAQLLRASIPKKVQLIIEDAPDAPPVEGDASQIGQVLMNLIINGAESIGDSGGTVRVGIRAQQLHEGESMRQGFDEVLAPGNYCLIEVIDDGCGMDASTRARIFEPFYTTKFTGRGLGLAAVLGIVRAHNGALGVKSKVGEGSQFRVLLPASAKVQPPAGKEPEKSDGESPFLWDGGVLLVDDEPPLRMVGQRMLERMGCRVWTAEDGLEGLKQYDAHADEIDLVILDLTMPNMDGHETLVELHRRAPGLPILIASGFTAEDLAVRFEGQAIAGTLQKPFGYHKLEAAVRAFVARREMV